jgi:hypothetical protein
VHFPFAISFFSLFFLFFFFPFFFFFLANEQRKIKEMQESDPFGLEELLADNQVLVKKLKTKAKKKDASAINLLAQFCLKQAAHDIETAAGKHAAVVLGTREGPLYDLVEERVLKKLKRTMAPEVPPEPAPVGVLEPARGFQPEQAVQIAAEVAKALKDQLESPDKSSAKENEGGRGKAKQIGSPGMDNLIKQLTPFLRKEKIYSINQLGRGDFDSAFFISLSAKMSASLGTAVELQEADLKREILAAARVSLTERIRNGRTLMFTRLKPLVRGVFKDLPTDDVLVKAKRTMEKQEAFDEKVDSNLPPLDDDGHKDVITQMLKHQPGLSDIELAYCLFIYTRYYLGYQLSTPSKPKAPEKDATYYEPKKDVALVDAASALVEAWREGIAIFLFFFLSFFLFFFLFFFLISALLFSRYEFRERWSGPRS